MVNTYFSTRVYKNKIKETEIKSIKDILVTANRAKYYAYKLLLLSERKKFTPDFEKSIHMLVKEKFLLNDYFANSAVQLANGILSSQKELQSQYIEDTKNQIKTRKKKIANLKRFATNKQKMLDSIIKGKLVTVKNEREFTPNGKIFCVKYKKKTDIYYNLYDFEHLYLVPQIKSLKNRINQIQGSIVSLEKKLISQNKGFKGACFGSSKLFKNQFTINEYTENHILWKEKFDNARYNAFQVSGRLDARFGNYVFKYNHVNKKLDFIINEKTTITFDNITFPYGQDNINYALENQKTLKKPISWTIEDHGDYYLFKVTINVFEKKDVNYSKVNGVIGIDTNYEHFAWSETNSKGILINHGIIVYDLQNKTNGQATKIIEKAVCELVSIAKQKNKPLIREALDINALKSKMKYKNKKSNKKISQFAYDKIISSIESRCRKDGVGLYVVNPAYTSQIGKMKYMKQKGISIHTSASYVIARRGMKFKENLPPVLFKLLPEEIVTKHHWTHWSFLTRHVKDIPQERFYGSPSTEECSSMESYVKFLKKSSA